MARKKRQKPHKFLQYIADTIKDRLEELGITRYRFVADNSDIISYPGLSKLYHAKQGTTIMVLNDVLDRLGMEIVIRPKQYENEDTGK